MGLNPQKTRGALLEANTSGKTFLFITSTINLVLFLEPLAFLADRGNSQFCGASGLPPIKAFRNSEQSTATQEWAQFFRPFSRPFGYVLVVLATAYSLEGNCPEDRSP
jgi:hypothetical protein